MKEKYGFEAFRYYLLREMSFGLDTDFAEAGLVQRVNADLANDLGNLLNRSVSMLGRYFDGVVPAHEGESPLREAAERVTGDVDRHMRAFHTQRALAALWELVGAANKYIDSEAPWQLAKDPDQRERLATVMAEVLECVRVIAVLLESFLPQASARIIESLGDTPNAGSLAERLRWGQLAAGTQTRRIEVLFPRIEAT
jgi:methionyl-tRNA synthetase